MTFSDDEVVGRVQTDTIHGTYGDQLVETEVFESVFFRDLDAKYRDRIEAYPRLMEQKLEYIKEIAALKKRVKALEARLPREEPQ